jgi:hypothetical protein
MQTPPAELETEASPHETLVNAQIPRPIERVISVAAIHIPGLIEGILPE